MSELSGRGLADRQAELVAALVAGGPAPAGFDPRALDATRDALLRKRAAEAARAWPVLAGELRTQWTATFARWATGRAPQGALRDGWDLARALSERGELPARAAGELAEREARWRYDGRSAPRRRLLPTLRRAPGALVVQAGGRVVTLHRRAR